MVTFAPTKAAHRQPEDEILEFPRRHGFRSQRPRCRASAAIIYESGDRECAAASRSDTRPWFCFPDVMTVKSTKPFPLSMYGAIRCTVTATNRARAPGRHGGNQIARDDPDRPRPHSDPDQRRPQHEIGRQSKARAAGQLRRQQLADLYQLAPVTNRSGQGGARMDREHRVLQPNRHTIACDRDIVLLKASPRRGLRAAASANSTRLRLTPRPIRSVASRSADHEQHDQPQRLKRTPANAPRPRLTPTAFEFPLMRRLTSPNAKTSADIAGQRAQRWGGGKAMWRREINALTHPFVDFLFRSFRKPALAGSGTNARADIECPRTKPPSPPICFVARQPSCQISACCFPRFSISPPWSGGHQISKVFEDATRPRPAIGVAIKRHVIQNPLAGGLLIYRHSGAPTLRGSRYFVGLTSRMSRSGVNDPRNGRCSTGSVADVPIRESPLWFEPALHRVAMSGP